MTNNAKSAPQISPFQYTGNGDGAIKENVNVFRGAVSFHYPLVTLPTRNGVGISLSAMYQSDIDRSVQLSNLTAPTSVMGLGWHFGYERIESSEDSYTIASERKYYFSDGNSRGELKKTARVWKRGTLLGLLDDNNQTLYDNLTGISNKSKIRKQLLNQQIVLSQAINVVEEDSETCRIEDDKNKNVYIFRREDKTIAIYDGGIQYENTCYDFTRITYYPQYEKWVITDKNGISKIYGDKQLQYGVCWDGWNGSSNIVNSKQRHYIKAWNLMCEQSLWNDCITYEYTYIKQEVGEHGLEYTKACYLAKIKDMFGYEVQLNYRDKEYDCVNNYNPREYIDPHKEIPSDLPDAYQSCYETKYLDSINCYCNQEFIQKIKFSYRLRSYRDINYLDRIAINDGEYYKRLLTQIQVIYTEEVGCVSKQIENALTTTFSYNEIGEMNEGALKQIKYPEGATVTYLYTDKELKNCSKRYLEITRPTSTSTPSIWFGSDYVVCSWKTGSHMEVSIYTWVGRWQSWSIEQDLDAFDIDSLEVITQENYIILKGLTTSNMMSIYMTIHKNPHVRGGYIEEESVIVDSKHVTITTGTSMYIVDDLENRRINMIRWNELKESWVKEDCFDYDRDRMNYFIMDQNKVFRLDYDFESAFGYKKNTLYLYTIDDLIGLKQQFVMDASMINMLKSANKNQFAWKASGSILAIVAVEESYQTSFNYSLYLYSITNDEKNYTITETFKKTYKCYKGNIDEIDENVWMPNIIDNSLVSVNGYLYRYNGIDWLVNEELREQLGTEEISKSVYAYGENYVVKTEYTKNEVLGQVIMYNPNNNSNDWKNTPVTLGHKVGEPITGRYQPTASTNTFTWDLEVYRMDIKDNQYEYVNQSTYHLPQDIVSTSVVNAAPYYIAGMQKFSENMTNTLAYVMEEGHLKICEMLNERFNNYENQELSKTVQRLGAASASTFYTFKLDKDDHIQSIKLYQLSGDSITTPINSCQVYKTIINDGLQNIEYEYRYDDDMAVCDPSNQFINYYKADVYPEYDGEHKLGYITYKYLNSLSMTRADENATHLSDLDGQLFCTETYDNEGCLVNKVTTQYDLAKEVYDFEERSMVPIYGQYVSRGKIENEKDQVVTKSEFYTSACTGEQAKLVTYNYNGEGKEEVHTQTIAYACEQENSFVYTNQLNCPSRYEKYITIDDTTMLVDRKDIDYESIRINNAKEEYEIKAALNCLRWTGEFNQTGQHIMRKVSTVLSRNCHGRELEKEAPANMPSTVIYDCYDQNIVAEFSMVKASENEAFYYGFEEREKLGLSWGDDKCPLTIVEGISHTGYRSLRWSKNFPVPTLNFVMNPSLEEYLIGFWCYGIGAKGSAMVQIKVEQDGNITNYAIPIYDNLDWKYYSQVIRVEKTSKISIQFINNSDEELYLDNLYLCAKDAAMKSYVYNKSGSLLIQVLSSYDQCSNFVYDSLNREIAQIDHNRTVLNLQLLNQYNSAADRMNSVIYLKNRGKGYYDRFTYLDLSAHWKDYENSSFECTDGMLRHINYVEESITLNMPMNENRYFAYMHVELDHKKIDNLVGVKVNSSTSMLWDCKNTQFILRINENTYFNKNVPFNEKWLILYDKKIKLFVSGQEVFSVEHDNTAKEFTLLAKNQVAIKNLMLGEDPQIGIHYYDLCGKLRQGSVIEEDGCTVTQILYDSASRVLLHTKPAHMSEENAQNVLDYKEDFVTEFDKTTGVMKGFVADYYKEDEGYPYVSQRYENMPNGRIVEKGQAGKTFAIRDLDTTSMLQRHTVKKQYATNDSDCIYDILNLPDKQYYTTITIDSDGKTQIEAIDQLGRNVATYLKVDDKEVQQTINRTIITYKDGKTITTKILPNGRLRKQIINPLGELLVSFESNSGEKHYIYNEQGKLRFMQDSSLHKENKWLYYKYDIFGRYIESGIVTYDDEEKLHELAMNAKWPDNTEHVVILEKKDYTQQSLSEECCKSNYYGMLRSTTLYDEQKKIVKSSYEYSYDSRRRITGYRTNIEIGEQTLPNMAYQQQYIYDNLDNLIQMNYSTGYQVNYEYDNIGRLTHIIDNQGKSICRYSYYPDDLIQSCSQGDGAFTTDYKYNSMGWITNISNPYFEEELIYNKDDTTGPFDGKVSYVKYTLKGDSVDKNLSEITYTINYDEKNRIASAICKNSNTNEVIDRWSINSIHYDANGNIVDIEADGEKLRYDYEENTDRVKKIDGIESFTYNENGAVTSSDFHNINAIEYDSTGLATNINTKDLNIIYDYNDERKRLVKQTDQTSKIYLTNQQGKAVEEIEYKGAEKKVNTEYIYGPYGLVAMRHNGEVSYVCLDHLGSVRVRVNDNKQVLNAVQYSPFGDKFELSDMPADVSKDLHYYFNGYEWDDETSLYNARARFYDPVLKRFYSVDPKLENDSPYVFCNNNPLIFTDPDGESSWWAILVGGIVSLALTVATFGAAAAVSASALAVTAATGAAATAISVATNAAVGAVGCAASSIIGTTVTAAIDSEPITAQMLLSSCASGFIAGAVSYGMGAMASEIDFAASSLKAFSRAALNGVSYATGSVAGGISSNAINGEIGNGYAWLELGLSSFVEFGAGALASAIDMRYIKKYGDQNGQLTIFQSFEDSMEQSSVGGLLQVRYTTQSMIENSMENQSSNTSEQQEVIAVHNIGANVVSYKTNGTSTIQNNQIIMNVTGNNQAINRNLPVKVLACFDGAYNKNALSGETFRMIAKEKLFGFQTICNNQLDKVFIHM